MSANKTDPNWVENYLNDLDFLNRRLGDFYLSDDLRNLGVECGENCMVHRLTIIVEPSKLKLGSNVRIDAFNVLSGTITIGSYVHISSHCLLMASEGITMGNYSNIAAGSKIFTVSDDMHGRGLIGPTVPLNTRHLKKGPVVMEDHTCMAINSTIMPGRTLAEGSVLLANSILYNCVTEPYSEYSGTPAVKVRDRDRSFLEYLKR
jgi:acetyltransferase-like isoleucine patch superfamily enzyme